MPIRRRYRLPSSQAHPRGEMWARSSGSTVSPACFRCLTASPRWAVFQRRSASGTRRKTGPRPGTLRPGRSDGEDVPQYPRHLRRVRSRSHPHTHPRGYGHRPRQRGIARQATQTVLQTEAGTLPHARHWRVIHQRSRRALLRLTTNLPSYTQPAPFPLAYDPAPYWNRPNPWAFPQLLGRESRRLPGPSLLDADPLQSCLYPFAGGLHEVCPSDEHHPAEELGSGAVVGSVGTFPEGYEHDILLGEIPLDLHARVEVPVEPVRTGDDYDVVCRIWFISTFQPVQDMELPVISSVKMCSSRIPNSWRTWGWVSGFRVASPVLLTRA